MNFGIAHINIQQPPKNKKQNQSQNQSTKEREESERQEEQDSQENIAYLKAKQNNKLTPNQLASEQEFGGFECALTDPMQYDGEEEEVKHTESSILDIEN